MSQYNANDIVSLSAGAAFRSKLGMYLAGEKQEAINLALRELIVNVQDEYEVFQLKNSYCKITLDTKTKIIQCEDNARGIPCAIRNDGINSLTAAFLIPHSGGKHEEGVYSSAIGINGEGNKIVCHTAKWLEVEVKRDGKIYFERFESNNEGAHAINEPQIIGTTKETGTKITYVADPAVYGDIFIDIEKLKEMLKNMSYFSKGLKFILIIDGKEEIFYSKNGLVDGLSNQNAISAPISFYYDTQDCKVELALQWVSKKGVIRGYANSLYVKDGGRFISMFKSSLTRTFNSLAKTNFTGEQIRSILDGFVSVKVKVGQWSNQQKSELANPEAGTATSTAISKCLKEFATSRKADFDKVVELLLRLQKAEKAADAARDAVLNQNKEMDKELKKKTVLAGKLADCRYHDERSQLLIVEGLSALGSIVKSRDSKFTAAFPLTGKIQNVLKNTLEKQLANEVLKNLHTALGCGYGDNFNIKKLRYGRIVIVCDADEDGYSIMCLLLAFFFKYYPELIKLGKVCWGQTPLFKIEAKNKIYYAYTDAEVKILPKGEITRAKGLGELMPNDFKETLFSENGRYIPFTMQDAAGAAEMFEVLLGEDVGPRREYLSIHADFDAFD